MACDFGVPRRTVYPVEAPLLKCAGIPRDVEVQSKQQQMTYTCINCSTHHVSRYRLSSLQIIEYAQALSLIKHDSLLLLQGGNP